MNTEQNMQFSSEMMDDIFNMNTEDIISDKSDSDGGGDPDYYKPSLKNPEALKAGAYDSLIRFLPNVFAKRDNMPAKQHHKVHKFLYYMTDPTNSERGFYVDCPSSVEGHPKAKKNIITESHFTLKKSESAFLRGLAYNQFNRKEFWWSLVLIMKDDYQPDLNGQIKIFRFGQQINEKIELLAAEDTKYHRPSVNVYHPATGRDMILMIANEEITDKNQQKKTITSYNKSAFLETSMPISLDGGVTRLTTEKADMERVTKFLAEKSPNLSKTLFKEWDNELEEKVIQSIRCSISDDQIFDAIYKKTYGEKFTGFNNGTNTGASQATNTTGSADVQATATNTVNQEQKVDVSQENSMASVMNAVTATQPKEEVKTEFVQPELVQEESNGGKSDVDFDDLP